MKGCVRNAVFLLSLILFLSLSHTRSLSQMNAHKAFQLSKVRIPKAAKLMNKKRIQNKRGKREKKRRETGFEMFCGSHNFAEMGKKYSGLKKNPEEPKHYFLKLVHCPLLSALVVNSGERSPAEEQTYRGHSPAVKRTLR